MILLRCSCGHLWSAMPVSGGASDGLVTYRFDFQKVSDCAVCGGVPDTVNQADVLHLIEDLRAELPEPFSMRATTRERLEAALSKVLEP